MGYSEQEFFVLKKIGNLDAYYIIMRFYGCVKCILVDPQFIDITLITKYHINWWKTHGYLKIYTHYIWKKKLHCTMPISTIVTLLKISDITIVPEFFSKEMNIHLLLQQSILNNKPKGLVYRLKKFTLFLDF